MAVDYQHWEAFAQRLTPIGRITTRKMFGGLGIYCDETFFALVYHDTLYFKADEVNRGEYEAAGMKPFQPFPDRTGVMKYYEVPEQVQENIAMLLTWAKKAVDAGRNGKQSGRKR